VVPEDRYGASPLRLWINYKETPGRIKHFANRVHISFLKDIVPLAGRGVLAHKLLKRKVPAPEVAGLVIELFALRWPGKTEMRTHTHLLIGTARCPRCAVRLVALKFLSTAGRRSAASLPRVVICGT
jgi:hypothetical protein